MCGLISLTCHKGKVAIGELKLISVIMSKLSENFIIALKLWKPNTSNNEKKALHVRGIWVQATSIRPSLNGSNRIKNQYNMSSHLFFSLIGAVRRNYEKATQKQIEDEIAEYLRSAPSQKGGPKFKGIGIRERS